MEAFCDRVDSATGEERDDALPGSRSCVPTVVGPLIA